MQESGNMPWRQGILPDKKIYLLGKFSKLAVFCRGISFADLDLKIKEDISG
jgi:hypothetical protein